MLFAISDVHFVSISWHTPDQFLFIAVTFFPSSSPLNSAPCNNNNNKYTMDEGLYAQIMHAHNVIIIRLSMKITTVFMFLFIVALIWSVCQKERRSAVRWNISNGNHIKLKFLFLLLFSRFVDGLTQ